MSEPISRPLEPSEISRLAGGDAYRFEMLLSQKTQEKTLVEMKETIREMSKWQIDHDKKDEVRFTETNMRMAEIEKSINGKGGVVSSVNDYNESKQQLKGAWRAIAILGIIITTIAGGLGWAWDHIVALFRGQS